MMENSFAKLLADLAQAEVKYITVGGLACALNGHIRTTLDVDILIERTPANIENLLTVLRGIGEGFAAELSQDDFDDSEGAIRLIEDFPIDIFTRMSGHAYADLLPFMKQLHVEGIAVPYLNAEGLILLKKNSLRDKDQLDVKILMHLLERK